MRTTGGLLLPLATLLATGTGCRPAPPPSGSPAPATTVRYTGTVVVSGVEGLTITSIRVEDRSVTVAGPLLVEIRSLSGARVTIEGAPAAVGPGEGVDVQRYEVVEVNGQRPWVGVLVRSGERYSLEDGGTVVILDRWPDGLTAHIGSKLWLTGNLVAGRLQVQSYGVIRAG